MKIDPCSSRQASLMLILFLTYPLLSLSSSECGNHGERKESQEWVTDGGFIILIFGVCVMFWGLAVVCEEYFVPSLNILCEEFNIPDDVAGATFMAAGASSPEMFTSFIALFINHSAIGVGTVVGSEIFNHMIICSGSVLYSETGVLQLEKFLFTRDVIGYIIALIALIWSLKSSFFHALGHVFDPDEREKCLDVTPIHAAGLVFVYVLYVIMSAYSQTFIKWINGESDTEVKELPLQEKEEVNPLGAFLLAEKMNDLEDGANKDEDRMASMLASIVEADIAATAAKDNSIRQSTIQSIRSSAVVPPVLMHSYQLQRSSKYYPSMGRVSNSSVKGPGARSNRLPAVDWTQSRATFVNDAPLYTWRSSGVRLEYLEHPGQTFIRTQGAEPSLESKCSCFRGPHSDELLIAAISPHQYSAYLYRRVASKYLSSYMKWELRYYSIDRWGFYSRKERTSAPRGPHLRIVDLTGVSEVKIINSGLEFQLICDDGNSIEFRAPTEEIRKHIVDRLQSHLATLHRLTAEGRAECHRIAQRNLDGGWTITESSENDKHSHGSLIDYPKVESGSFSGYFQIASHYSLLPLKYVLYYTLPEVTGSKGRNNYILCLVISIIWLAILSFVMVSCCDEIGSFIGASPIVMGLTLSAIGTSFPNLWSSMLVARQGLGDMAVGNAFGSNTFNICIALGMPWLVRAFVTDFSSYRKMEDDGIVFMLLLLILVTIIFYIMIMLHDWQIRKWYENTLSPIDLTSPL